MRAVSQDMKADIQARLKRIEEEEDIKIILAIESGSRAWGFHSPDSDYDVRFIFTRPVDWFLNLGAQRDVVERPIDAVLDISGWQLDKALRLALKGNAVIAEWLQSPITYQSNDVARSALITFCQQAIQRRPISWHYLSLTDKHLERALKPDGTIRLKRLFYALRPALALRWMRLNDAPMPPMDMTQLCAGAALKADEIGAIKTLTEQKMKLAEKATYAAADRTILTMIRNESATTKNWLAQAPETDAKPQLLDAATALHKRLTYDADITHKI